MTKLKRRPLVLPIWHHWKGFFFAIHHSRPYVHRNQLIKCPRVAAAHPYTIFFSSALGVLCERMINEAPSKPHVVPFSSFQHSNRKLLHHKMASIIAIRSFPAGPNKPTSISQRRRRQSRVITTNPFLPVSDGKASPWKDFWPLVKGPVY